jgi:hypothetical protein
MSDLIEVKPGRMWEAIEEAEQKLLPHAEKLGLYQRNGRVVRFFTKGEKEQYENVSSVEMRAIFERLARFSDGKRYIDCPARLASDYLRLGRWKLPSR